MTQQSGGSGYDPIGDFQRWLFRSGAREAGRSVTGQIRDMLGMSERRGDVWEKATSPPSDEPPECAWCPICRAARTLKESGPGVASQAAAVGEAVSTIVQDVMSAVEAAVAASRRAPAASANPDAGADGPLDGSPPDSPEPSPGNEPETAALCEGSPREPDDRS